MGFQPIKESAAYVPVDIIEHLNQLGGQIHDLTVELMGERFDSSFHKMYLIQLVLLYWIMRTRFSLFFFFY